MPIPVLENDGFLPMGVHDASLRECVARFGVGPPVRTGFAILLTEVVNAAQQYPTIKRVLVWGSFISDKSDPNDLDYSVVVSVYHRDELGQEPHRRFLVAREARAFYGVDRGYLTLNDYPVEGYASLVGFICQSRIGRARGIVEISLRGESLSERSEG